MLAKQRRRISQLMADLVLGSGREAARAKYLRTMSERPMQDNDVDYVSQAIHRVMACQAMLERT